MSLHARILMQAFASCPSAVGCGAARWWDPPDRYVGTYEVVNGVITHGHLDVADRSGGGSSKNCDPHYPDFCIPPPPPDLDCPEIGRHDFTALPPDPHHFDRDRDRIGCEVGGS